MKKSFYFLAFFLGISLGILMHFDHLHMTSQSPSGAAIATCTLNNQPCTCNTTDCTCKNTTIDSTYCSQDLNNLHHHATA